MTIASGAKNTSEPLAPSWLKDVYPIIKGTKIKQFPVYRLSTVGDKETKKGWWRTLSIEDNKGVRSESVILTAEGYYTPLYPLHSFINGKVNGFAISDEPADEIIAAEVSQAVLKSINASGNFRYSDRGYLRVVV